MLGARKTSLLKESTYKFMKKPKTKKYLYFPFAIACESNKPEDIMEAKREYIKLIENSLLELGAGAVHVVESPLHERSLTTTLYVTENN